MILEKETYEKYGYYPDDKFSRRILVACDICGKIREIKKYNYRALCISCAARKRARKSKYQILNNREWLYAKYWEEELSSTQIAKIANCSKDNVIKALKRLNIKRRSLSDSKKGNKNPRYEKHFSEEEKQKKSDALKGENSPLYGKHPSEITRAKMRKVRKERKGFPKHHTKPELIFEQICKRYNLPFKYTGDGSFWLSKNPSINPDFVECNGKKIAIEIFSYWHDPLRRHCKVPYSQTYEGRKKILKKCGWKLIVFWDADLLRKDAEQFVLNTLKRSM